VQDSQDNRNKDCDEMLSM